MDGVEPPVGSTRRRIKWRACGLERRDRQGLVDGVEVLQITRVYGSADYSLKFHHVEQARLSTLEEAKLRAERDLELWCERRRLLRERDAAEAARQLRERRARELRLAALVERLNAAGIAARDVFGAVTLTDDSAERVLARLAGAEACSARSR